MLQNVDRYHLIDCHQLPSIKGSYHQFVTVATNRLFAASPVTTNEFCSSHQHCNFFNFVSHNQLRFDMHVRGLHRCCVNHYQFHFSLISNCISIENDVKWYSSRVTRIIPHCNSAHKWFQFINIFVQAFGETRPLPEAKLVCYKPDTYTGTEFGHHFVSILKFGSLISTWSILKMLMLDHSTWMNSFTFYKWVQLDLSFSYGSVIDKTSVVQTSRW